MCCHVADSPYGLTGRTTKLLFRIHTAMAGNMGTEANLLKWKKDELNILRDKITEYKSIRGIIHKGDLFRIESPYNSRRVTFMYVSKDKSEAVLFAYLLKYSASHNLVKVKLKGLAPALSYNVELGNKKIRANGRRLMNQGIIVPLENEQDTKIIKIKKNS
jgi:alpha-galactosidase